jgi:hypothetical protein
MPHVFLKINKKCQQKKNMGTAATSELFKRVWLQEQAKAFERLNSRFSMVPPSYPLVPQDLFTPMCTYYPGTVWHQKALNRHVKGKH